MSAAKNTAKTPVTLDHPINKKITDEWVNLTPTLAEKWLGQNHGNRNMRPMKVKAFTRDMRNASWGTDGSPFRFDWNGVLMDGQHRCAAVIESGATIRALVVRNLDPATREIMDTGTKRTPADALHFAGFEKDNNVTAAVAKIALGRENGYLRTAFAGSAPNITNTETVDWVRDHDGASQAVALARSTYKQIGITPSPWAYCLFEMTQVDGQAAVEFATSMNEFRGLRGKTDPRVAMLTAFRNAALGKRRVPSQSESIYLTFRAWNAWVTNKSLTSIIPRDSNGRGNDIPKLAAPTAAFRERYL